MSVQALSWVLDYSLTTGADRLVLISLANHAGKEPVDGAWESWPGIATIAREARTAERTVTVVLARLVHMGAIERLVNSAPDSRLRGDKRPNLYRILTEDGGTLPDDGVPHEGTPSPEATSPTGYRLTTQRGTASRHNGVPPHDTNRAPIRKEPSLEPSSEPKDPPFPPEPSVALVLVAPPLPVSSAVDFEVWWQVYPRKAAKESARKAWSRALKAVDGDAARLMAGAERYRDDPNRENEFTAHAASWLNAGRWDDEPLPSRSPSRTREPVADAAANYLASRRDRT